MTKFIKYYTIFVCIYIAISAFGFLSYFYVLDYGKGRDKNQVYYLDSCDYETFLSKYRELYLSRSVDSLDYFVFTRDTLKSGEYKTEIKKYVEDQYVIGQDYVSECNYYLSSIDGYICFDVIKSEPLKLILDDYYPSVKKIQEEQWNYGCAYWINSMTLPYSYNEGILDAFEQSVLGEFASYRRDRLQEWETKYCSYFELFFMRNISNLEIFFVLSALLIGGLFLLLAIVFIREVIIPMRIKDLYSGIRKDIEDFLY